MRHIGFWNDSEKSDHFVSNNSNMEIEFSGRIVNEEQNDFYFFLNEVITVLPARKLA